MIANEGGATGRAPLVRFVSSHTRRPPAKRPELAPRGDQRTGKKIGYAATQSVAEREPAGMDAGDQHAARQIGQRREHGEVCSAWTIDAIGNDQRVGQPRLEPFTLAQRKPRGAFVEHAGHAEPDGVGDGDLAGARAHAVEIAAAISWKFLRIPAPLIKPAQCGRPKKRQRAEGVEQVCPDRLRPIDRDAVGSRRAVALRASGSGSERAECGEAKENTVQAQGLR